MAKVIPIIKNNRKFFKRHESEIPCLFFMKFNNRASAGSVVQNCKRRMRNRKSLVQYAEKHMIR